MLTIVAKLSLLSVLSIDIHFSRYNFPIFQLYIPVPLSSNIPFEKYRRYPAFSIAMEWV